jgi:hypothetical protein
MNDEVKAICSYFIVHRSYFIVFSFIIFSRLYLVSLT